MSAARRFRNKAQNLKPHRERKSLPPKSGEYHEDRYKEEDRMACRQSIEICPICHEELGECLCLWHFIAQAGE